MKFSGPERHKDVSGKSLSEIREEVADEIERATGAKLNADQLKVADKVARHLASLAKRAAP